MKEKSFPLSSKFKTQLNFPGKTLTNRKNICFCGQLSIILIHEKLTNRRIFLAGDERNSCNAEFSVWVFRDLKKQKEKNKKGKFGFRVCIFLGAHDCDFFQRRTSLFPLE